MTHWYFSFPQHTTAECVGWGSVSYCITRVLSPLASIGALSREWRYRVAVKFACTSSRGTSGSAATLVGGDFTYLEPRNTEANIEEGCLSFPSVDLRYFDVFHTVQWAWHPH